MIEGESLLMGRLPVLESAREERRDDAVVGRSSSLTVQSFVENATSM
jgi:hypothetical protein